MSTTAHTSASHRTYGLLACIALLYALLYVAFFPPIHTTMDESAYLNQAYALRAGTLYSDVAGISTVQSYPVGQGTKHHIISEYPPGMGSLLAGASLGGWRVALGVNLLVHLACFLVLALVLQRLNVWPGFAALYLLHPTAVIFSRTTMSDLTCGLLTLLAFALSLRGRWVLSGIVVGLGVWVRTVGGLALPLLCLGAFLDAVFPLLDKRVPLPPFINRVGQGIVRVVWVAMGAVPLVVGAWLYQKILQENGWAKYSGEGLLGLRHFPHQFPVYALQLSVMFPLMLIAPAFYRRAGRATLMSLCYGVLLFYCCYYFQDATGSKLESFVIGLRFLLMVIPLYVIAYGTVIQELLQRTGIWQRHGRWLSAAFALILITLFAVAGVIHRKHQEFLRQSAATRDAVARVLGGAASGDQALLLCNIHVAKLLHPGWSGAHHFTVIGAESSVNQIEDDIQSAEREGRPVYLAFWSRSARPETPGEMSLLRQLTARFPTEPAASQLPPDVYLLRIHAPLPAAPSPRPLANSPGKP